MITYIFKINDTWFFYSLISLFIILLIIFYYLINNHDINNKFLKFGLHKDLVFLHDKINSITKLKEIYILCAISGFIIAYWNKISGHTMKKNSYSLLSFIIIIKIILQYGFNLILIHMTFTKSLQFTFFFIIGYLLFELPFVYYNSKKHNIITK